MRRLLFVDDEPALLDGLRRSLYRAQKSWDMTFVASGALAISELERRPYDVIVADMRMARLDGAQLLERACESAPDTVRIVLSGYCERSETLRLVPLAHRYLAKPCPAARLQQTIENSLQLRELIRNPAARAMVGQIRTIPTIPTVYARLRELLAQEATSAEQVAELIARDSAVAAKVLQVANSAFFRQVRDICSLEQAVVHLGFDVIRTLVLSTEVFSIFPKTMHAEGLGPDDLQTHVQNVAAGARVLAGTAAWAEEAMLAGLLHDFGYWILLQQCPLEVARARRLANREGIAIEEAEYRLFETSHAEIGAYLLGLWGLPDPIVEAAAFHHKPAAAAQTEFGVVAAVAIAHAVTDTMGAGSLVQRDLDRVRAVDASYLKDLHAPFDWHQAEERITGLLA